MISHDPTHSPATASASVPPGHLAMLQAAYADNLRVDAAWSPGLRGVIDQTLNTPGAMNRALLAHGLMSAWGAPREQAVQAATAIEYWHAASLLFDDLPCMDDATERRGEACAHRRFGESSAILGALALVNRAYFLSWNAMSSCPAGFREDAAKLVEECLGAAGILNGQALDLAFARSDRTACEVLKIADGKTGTLLRLTLQWPALLAGVNDPLRQNALRDLAQAWGRAYQIMDDFKDILLTPEESGKTAGRDALHGHPNLVIALGETLARETLLSELHRAASAIATLMRDPAPAAILLARHRQFEQQAAALQIKLAQGSVA